MIRLLLIAALALGALSLPHSGSAQFYSTPGFYRYDPVHGNYFYTSRVQLPVDTGTYFTGSYSGYYPTASYYGYYPTASYYSSYPVNNYYTAAYYSNPRSYIPLSSVPYSASVLYSPVPRAWPSRQVSVGPLWYPGYGVAAY